MANLRRTRRHLWRILIALGVLDVLALLVLATPIASTAPWQAEFDSLRTRVQARLKEVVPPEQMEQRIAEARTQIDDFYRERVAGENSTIAEQLGGMAQQQHVTVSEVRYAMTDAAEANLKHLDIEATLTGDYLQEMKFLNQLERSKMFVIIRSVTLGGQEGGAVQLHVKIETFRRSES